MSIPGLFPSPSDGLVQGLAEYRTLLNKVVPLRPKHRDVLPGKIRFLSECFAVDLDKLPRDYMNQPPLVGAYLHHFLPWHLYRQGRLLEGLELDLRPGTRILDLGAGPLTFLQSLWLARPALRRQELSYLGVDRSDGVLKHGRRLFGLLAPQADWKVQTMRRPVGALRGMQADLLVLANVLAELDLGEPRVRGRDEDSDEATPHDLMLERWEGMLGENAAILLIEPGMRVAGRSLFRLREAALERGWRVEAPCPHAAECPMPGLRNRPWCHFNFVPNGAPVWLDKLSRRARLPHERSSLSFLLLTRGAKPPVEIAADPQGRADNVPVRVISESFDLPGNLRGRYGCSAHGLTLLQERKGELGISLRSGDRVEITWPEDPRRDAKSGAWIIPRSG